MCTNLQVSLFKAEDLQHPCFQPRSDRHVNRLVQEYGTGFFYLYIQLFREKPMDISLILKNMGPSSGACCLLFSLSNFLFRSFPLSSLIYVSIYMNESLQNPEEHEAFRNPENLKRMLTNAYFSRLKDIDPEVKICGTKRCRDGTCPYLKQGKEFTFSATNETFRIKHSMNCTSTNLIYAITCAGCGHNYIGCLLYTSDAATKA